MDNDSVIKVVLPGKSIGSADPEDYVLVAGLPTMSVKRRLKIRLTTVSANSGYGTAVVEHGFGYVPQTIAFITTRTGTTYPSTYINVPGQWGDSVPVSNHPSFQSFNCEVDAQNVYVSATSFTTHPVDGSQYRSDTYEFDILLMAEEVISV